MKPLHQLGALEAGRAIGDGSITSEQLVRACLDRIEALEPELRAWAHIDAGQAMAAARSRDQETRRSALHGVPIGIKDVIDTADFPTCFNSEIYRQHRPEANASIVDQALAAGLVILGKTATQEFATRGNMPATQNPRAPGRMPGGSSSGSAAGVAAGMVPLALSTQTAGSILRPASYCGVVGFKPTFGRLGTAGMKRMVPSFDTLGFHARSVVDVRGALAAIENSGLSDEPVSLKRPLNLALCKTEFWPQSGDTVRQTLQQVVELLSSNGHKVTEVELGACFDGLSNAHDTISDLEARQSLDEEWRVHPELLSAGVKAKLARGAAVLPAAYAEAVQTVNLCRTWTNQLLGSYDCILTPSAPDVAPLLETGDPGSSSFNKFWTSVGSPAISLPASRPEELPVGIQLVGRDGQDERLLEAAQSVESLLATAFGQGDSSRPG